jgi:Zn2+/Cd2+-exporting ATPase
MHTSALPPHPHHPVLFEEFFEMGLQESISPFLTPTSRKWGAYLTLKASIVAACLLVFSFFLSLFPSTLYPSYFFLIIVYFLAGIPSLIESIEDLLNLEINIDILMTLAAFSSVLIGSGMEGGLLLVLFALSGSMEDAVTSRAKNSISNLHKLSPTRATVLDAEGTLVERSIQDIAVGTPILVKSGQIVPLDGVVFDGISSVNLVHLTGENLPVTKKEGDEIPAGARNLEGALKIHVTHTSANSTLARIIQLVTQAQEARPTLQRWFDKLSRGYAITIISLSALFALSFPFLFHIPFLGIEGSIYRALAFLIAASPCALIIAIPIAYLSAISVCAKRGILLKGGVVLDALAKCKAIAFDKTGTLTTGELRCLGFESLENSSFPPSLALEAAYALEKNAVHPIAKAILSYAQDQKSASLNLKEYRSVPGYGLEGLVQTPQGDLKIYLGHPDYIIPLLSPEQVERLHKQLETIRERGELVAVLLLDDHIYLFRFADTLRPNIDQTLKRLHQQHQMRLIMLTGDHASNAGKMAQEAGIDEYHADLKPEDKLNYVSKLSESLGLAMVGDGINDAPALARSTVGISMGKMGSDAAIDASDVVLLHDNIDLLDWLFGKARQTQRIVKENLILATSAIFLAALPALAGWIPLWLAVVMHEGGTVLVGLNALRLLRK